MSDTDFTLDFNLSSLAYAFGKPSLEGVFGMVPTDFLVIEELGFLPAGSGEHVFLHIEKINTNTMYVAELLARLAKVKLFDVSFAGLKDKNAVTRQWFSVYLPNTRTVDWKAIESPEITLLEITRHTKKLRRGTLLGNHFTILLRDVKGCRLEAQDRLENIAREGVPNYFGPQRFGFMGNNLNAASRLFADMIRPSRAKRSLYLSAARSWLFNLVLNQRILRHDWRLLNEGDVLMLAGSQSYFICKEVNEECNQRILNNDISPTGPLFGKGELSSEKSIADLENAIQAQYPAWIDGLAKAGLHQERRPLILPLTKFESQFKEDYLSLSFFLPRGSYATSVLREIIHMNVWKISKLNEQSE